jgi:hypothetical protein
MSIMRKSTRIDAFASWFIRSDYMDARQFGSTSDDWINDSDRMERCADAAIDGSDGSTHRETIDDWRTAFESWIVDVRRRRRHGDRPERFIVAVLAYFDSVEAWHESHGTLDQTIG